MWRSPTLGTSETGSVDGTYLPEPPPAEAPARASSSASAGSGGRRDSTARAGRSPARRVGSAAAADAADAEDEDDDDDDDADTEARWWSSWLRGAIAETEPGGGVAGRYF